MSSFIVSSNTSQPLVLRNQDIADNQPSKSIYSLNETLNFLILLVSYVHDYTLSLVAHVDGVMMHLEELLVQDMPGTGPRLVKIYFHPDKLCYWFNDCIHQYSHEPTVRYIYHLMGLMDIRWMNIVLRYVNRLKPASLTFTVVNSIPYDLYTYESTLRRYLSLPQTVLKQMIQKGGMLRSEEYATEFINILRKDGHRTNMYENVDGYLKDKDRQTIYMHQFFMYGNYSDQYKRFTLAYLLVMEAVLDRTHVWLHLHQNTHYCQIEQYHIYIWRNRWRLNGWLNIFMDSEMNQAMVHPKGPGSRQYFVNDPADMDEYLKEFEHTLMLEFFQIFFFKRLAPFEVLSLKDLSRCVTFLNFFIKSISLIFDLGLSDERDLEKPSLWEQYPRYSAMLASQMA